MAQNRDSVDMSLPVGTMVSGSNSMLVLVINISIPGTVIEEISVKLGL